jgi:hypothetical protein
MELWKKIMSDIRISEKERDRIIKLVGYEDEFGTFKNEFALKGILRERANDYPDIMEQIKANSKQLYPYYTIESGKTPAPAPKVQQGNAAADIWNKTGRVIPTTVNQSSTARTLNNINQVAMDYKTIETNHPGLTSDEMYKQLRALGYSKEDATEATDNWVDLKSTP